MDLFCILAVRSNKSILVYRLYANHSPFPRKDRSISPTSEYKSITKNYSPIPKNKFWTLKWKDFMPNHKNVFSSTSNNFSPFPRNINSSAPNNYSQFPRKVNSHLKNYSTSPKGEYSQFPRNGGSKKNYSPFPRNPKPANSKIYSQLPRIFNWIKNNNYSLYPKGEYSKFPRTTNSSTSFSRFPRSGKWKIPMNKFWPFPKGEYSKFPRTGNSTPKNNVSAFPRKANLPSSMNELSPILNPRSRYPKIGMRSNKELSSMKSTSLMKYSPINKNNQQSKSQENAAMMLNRIVLASLAFWIGAIGFYWLAKLREAKPCDPNQPPEIIMTIKAGEKSFKATNKFHAKLPSVSKARKYKDFKQACNRLKTRGVDIKPSLIEKGLWYFSYTVERPTLEEVIEDEKKMSRIVNDEIRELARLENFSKFLRWFKYAK